MPVIAGRTREQLRVSIGYALGVVTLIEADASGSTSTFLTDDIAGGADDHIGKHIVFTSGTNDGSKRRVTDSSISSNQTTLTSHPVVSASTANGDTAELWDQKFDPVRIEDYINQAIIDATGHTFDPIENIALHGDGKTARFDIPANIAMIKRLEYRSQMTSTIVHSCERTFDETTDSDFTQTIDTKDYKHGGSSLKLTIGGSVSAGDLVTDSLTSVNLAEYTHIEGWVKATSTLAANDFVLRLDSGTVQGNSSDLEILNIPATTAADTWTYFRVALATPELDTAIISIGFEYNANHGANTVWFDEVIATRNNSYIWNKVPSQSWRIDKEARDLILSQDGMHLVGHSLLKISGGDTPTLLTADSTATEIDDSYVISYAVSMAHASEALGTGVDFDGHQRRADRWFQKALLAKQSFPSLWNVRHVS